VNFTNSISVNFPRQSVLCSAIQRETAHFPANIGRTLPINNLWNGRSGKPDQTVGYLIMVVLCNRADHYIFALWFLSFFFFSSPNLSGRRLDVYHTSSHGVAL